MKTKPISGETSRLKHLSEYDYFSFYSRRIEGVLIVREKTPIEIVCQHTETGKIYKYNKLDRPVKFWTDIIIYQATPYKKFGYDNDRD